MTAISEVPARDLARRGMGYVEEAVLKVLREAEYPLQPAEIACEAGLFGTPAGHEFNYLTQGILDKLENDGRVRSRGNPRRWEIVP